MVRFHLFRDITDSFKSVASPELSLDLNKAKLPPLSTSLTIREFSSMVKISQDKSSPSEDSNLPSKSLESKEELKAAKSKLSSKKKKSLKIMLIVQSEDLMTDKPVDKTWLISKDSKCWSWEESFPNSPALKQIRRTRRNDALLFKSWMMRLELLQRCNYILMIVQMYKLIATDHPRGALLFYFLNASTCSIYLT